MSAVLDACGLPASIDDVEIPEEEETVGQPLEGESPADFSKRSKSRPLKSRAPIAIAAMNLAAVHVEAIHIRVFALCHLDPCGSELIVKMLSQ